MERTRDPTRKSPPLTQLSLFGPLRHIEQALEREYQMLSKTDRHKFGPALRAVREAVRDLNEKLANTQEKRSKRNAR